MSASSAAATSTTTPAQEERQQEQEQEQEQKQDGQDETLYCICKRPYREADDMVGCDGRCNQWYHLKCLGYRPCTKHVCLRGYGARKYGRVVFDDGRIFYGELKVGADEEEEEQIGFMSEGGDGGSGEDWEEEKRRGDFYVFVGKRGQADFRTDKILEEDPDYVKAERAADRAHEVH